MKDVYIWVIAFILFAVIEMVTVQLVTVWFALGSVAAFISTFFNTDLQLQIVIFLAVSFISLLIIRPFAGKCLKKDNIKTNAESLVGTFAIVTDRIHNPEGTGRANVRGQDWSAAADNDEDVFEPGEKVVIKEIRGVKLICSRV